MSAERPGDSAELSGTAFGVVLESGQAPREPGFPVGTVWPLRWAVALVLAVAGLTLLSSRTLRALPHSGLGATGISLAILATFASVYAVELGIVWLVARRSGSRFAESVGMRRVPHMGKWLGVAFAAALGLRVAATAYAGLMFSMHWTLPGWDSNPMKYFPRTTLGVTVLVALIAIGAPIVEETIFRGVLLPSLGTRFGEGWAVAITTIVFAAMHLNPFSFTPVLVVGWTLAALFLRARSLWVSIACHSAFNGIGVLIVLLARGSGVV